MGSKHLLDVLTRIDEVAARGQLPVVVFDLDSTLFVTTRRNQAILNEFLAVEGLDIPPINADEIHWDPADPLRARGVDEAVVKRIYRFWKPRFFSDAYVLLDQPSPGAVAYVRETYRRGALVYYLTGRFVPGMSTGTVQALTNTGFPYWCGRTVLHLKPSAEADDQHFKQRAAEEIASVRGEVVATFDNEPANCNILQRAFPTALNFWMDTEHSPDAEPRHPSLLSTKDFLVSGLPLKAGSS